MSAVATSCETLSRACVNITVGDCTLEGDLDMPAHPRGIVIFAHGSGSSRHSPRNQYVARIIREAGFATLLFDLLTHDEDDEDAMTGRLRFDIPMLAHRLVGATHWIQTEPKTQGLAIGYFGASTGAAAALVAAAQMDDEIKAIVSRGGRPDLATSALSAVRCPTLLIVGGCDQLVICMNDDALTRLRCEKQLRLIPGATHLFEEPGKLEHVAQLSAQWFLKHLSSKT